MSEIRVIMPKLGMTMQRGTVVEWRKQEGDKIKKDEVIAIIASEKITNELKASNEGILKKVLHGVGDEVTVGETIAIIETEE